MGSLRLELGGSWLHIDSLLYKERRNVVVEYHIGRGRKWMGSTELEQLFQSHWVNYSVEPEAYGQRRDNTGREGWFDYQRPEHYPYARHTDVTDNLRHPSNRL